MRSVPLIVGGGPAGAVAAATLAAERCRPLLLERDPVPRDRICGEFLSGEGQLLLQRVGLDVGRLGGQPIDRVRIVAPRAQAEIPLPFLGLGVSRRRLDEALLDHARALGAKVERGVRVAEIRTGPSGLAVGTAAGDLTPATLFLATGKHDVRGVERPRSRADRVGFKMHFRPSRSTVAALASAVELHLFRDGYAGLQLVDDGQLNLCLIVGRDVLARAGGGYPMLLDRLRAEAPAFARRLDGAEPLFPRPLAIAGVPYGHLAAASEPGLFRLGDQAAVIASFTGDGMAIALATGRLAARAWLDGGAASAPAFQARVRRAMQAPLRLGGAFQQLGARPVFAGIATELASRFPSAARTVARWTRVPRDLLA